MKKHLSTLVVSCLLFSTAAEAKLFQRENKIITVSVIVGANASGLTCKLVARKNNSGASMQSQAVNIKKAPLEPSDCFSDIEVNEFVESAFKHLHKSL